MKIRVSRLRQIIREAVEEMDDERSEILSFYSDVFKDKNGVRPRWIWQAWKDRPIQELKDELQELIDSPSYMEDEPFIAPEDDHGWRAPQASPPRDEPFPGTLEPEEEFDPHAERIPSSYHRARAFKKPAPPRPPRDPHKFNPW